MAAAVQASDLLEVAWVSLLAGVCITLTFSLVVLGSGHAAAARRTGHGTAAKVYTGLALLAGAVFLGGVVLGVNIMLAK
jgi:hypothetical protein